MREPSIPRETHSASEKLPTPIYPLHIVSINDHLHMPAPLARITTCGTFQFQVLQEVLPTNPPQGRYVPVTREQRPRSTSTALILLKILTNQPDQRVSREWLREHL